jgi:DNA-binding NarL/FixJ family response regulator
MIRPIRVLLVDDQELFRSGVRVVLEAQSDMVVVGEAANGEEALRSIESLAPDIVMLDMRMPIMDGLETTRAIFSAPSDRRPPRVIVLTTFSLDTSAAAAIRLGASGFLLKDSSAAFLCEAIRVVHGGTSVIAPDELQELFRPDRALPTFKSVPASYGSLTERELVIFSWAARGLSNFEIAARESVAESTIKTQMSSILGKLQLRDRVQLVVFAHDFGLL